MSASTLYSDPDADATKALTRLNEAITHVRTALQKCAERQTCSPPTTLNNDDPAPTAAASSLTTLSHTVLSHTVAVKLAHEAIIRSVDESREKLHKNQTELLQARLKLQNLRYERHTLERQIADCRAKRSPFLLKTAVHLPDDLFDTRVSDDHLTANLKTVENALNQELIAREALRDDLNVANRAIDEKRRVATALREGLRRLPAAVLEIRNAVHPVRKWVGDHPNPTVDLTHPQIGRLHEPLYVLAREAIALRHAFGRPADVRVEDDAVGDALYQGSPHAVILDIIAEGVVPLLRVRFRYLWRLGIVVVVAKVVVNGDECDEYPIKDLQLLFPEDRGDVSPRGANAHLEDGTFTLDIEKAGGRPFIWANVACGIECVPARQGSGAGWVREMWDMMSHMRMREAVDMLQGRLRGAVMLKEQVDALMDKRSCVSAADCGLAHEPLGQIEDFVKLGRGDGDADGDRDGYSDRRSPTEDVWEMRVRGAKGAGVRARIAIEADYPLGRPVFRVEAERDKPAAVSETELVRLERRVNEAQPADGSAETLLGAQVTTLLVTLDLVEEARGAP